MIYIAVFAVLATLIGFYLRFRSHGLFAVLLDLIVATVLGWVAGLLIGLGARIAMWSIPYSNGAEPRITFEGTLQVVLIFSLYGIGLGLVYDFVLRNLLYKRGLFYGVLITAVAAYPLASAGFQQLTFKPTWFQALTASLIFVGTMFVPFAVVLELGLGRWHRYRELAPNPVHRVTAH